MKKSVTEEIRHVDRLLRKLVGLTNDPQAMTMADGLLDRRLLLMQQRERGFSTVDRRRVRG